MNKILTYVLTPLSWIYGAVMWVRNKLFNIGWLPQVEFDVPIIGVGNITVGGTGKTPHTEYIVSQLCASYKLAVLSRGYKRKTHGFIVANSKSSPETIGDEPWQIYNKFGRRIKVAVCESRKKGISELLKLYPDIELIILDDSFQHRWVKPKISILLMEYERPVYNDHLLPLGRLRESSHEINRADKVIVTKCPESLSPIDYRIVTKNLDLMKYQKLYFSRYAYEELQPVFPEDARFKANLAKLTAKDSVLLLTGIAHPRYFVRHFREYPFSKKVEHFSDHHDFKRADIQRIDQRFRAMKGERKLIVTTEKDAVRLVHNPYFPQELKPFVFFQPISVRMVTGPYGHDNDLIADIRSEIGLGDSTAVAEPEYPAPTLSGQRQAADEADVAEPVELSRNDSEDAGDKPGIISPGYYDSESSTDSISEDDSKGDADSSIADTLS
ncbi:MAG: tetraacyldisaccharide 4'-kinase [Muribaculaceae bacterium]|nr:tetraacyldisaccharide 4'-kinase [Muribaculaceae bacterium]